MKKRDIISICLDLSMTIILLYFIFARGLGFMACEPCVCACNTLPLNITNTSFRVLGGLI